MNRVENDFHIKLYRLFGFYLEVLCKGEKPAFEKFNTFNSTHLLESYLDRINSFTTNRKNGKSQNTFHNYKNFIGISGKYL